MNDQVHTGSSTPRSPADLHLRELVEIMSVGSDEQIKSAQVKFYRLLHAQLAKSQDARRLGPDFFKDIFQETMMTVWDRLPTFRGESSLVTWVHGIFHFKAADKYRKTEYRIVDQLDNEEELTDVVSEPAVSLSKKQVQLFLEGCIGKLRARSIQRAAAINLVRHEYSMEEISVSLEAPIGTVKRWLFEARQELASCMRRHGATNSEG